MTTISYNDFKKMDMRVVRVINAEPISGRSRILKLAVDIGEGVLRTIVVGGAQYYKPEAFEKKNFVALVNLTPKRIANIESQGMLLAADTGENPIWLMVASDVSVGTRII